MSSVRNVSIHMRTTKHEKSLLQHAAELSGFSNLTNFILTVARKEAHRIISDPNITYVSEYDWDRIQKANANPNEPNENLKKLLSE